MDNRIALVLFNLGGPDSLDAVEGFLFNLFSDPDIFRLPLAFVTQKPFARLIARRRVEEAKVGYAAMGGRSPLRENTERQARALGSELGGDFDVHICMRYWHPLTREVVSQLKAQGHERVILLPLYPQYSTTTTGSSYNEFLRECSRQQFHPRMTLVEHWHDDSDYQQAIVETILAEAGRLPDPDPAKIELLFSAHGLPRKVIERGDPYEMQVRSTYDALVRRLGWPRTTLCYQSRVGPLEWLRPYTEDTIRHKASAGARQMLIYPISFVSDHIETLYELGVTYGRIARGLGVHAYRVVPALNDHPRLILALKNIVLGATKRLMK